MGTVKVGIEDNLDILLPIAGTGGDGVVDTGDISRKSREID